MACYWAGIPGPARKVRVCGSRVWWSCTCAWPHTSPINPIQPPQPAHPPPAAAAKWAAAEQRISAASMAIGLIVFLLSWRYLYHFTETTGQVGTEEEHLNWVPRTPGDCCAASSRVHITPPAVSCSPPAVRHPREGRPATCQVRLSPLLPLAPLLLSLVCRSWAAC